jgi:hypothetical protein
VGMQSPFALPIELAARWSYTLPGFPEPVTHGTECWQLGMGSDRCWISGRGVGPVAQLGQLALELVVVVVEPREWTCPYAESARASTVQPGGPAVGVGVRARRV